jgi:hypothetical protein
MNISTPAIPTILNLPPNVPRNVQPNGSLLQGDAGQREISGESFAAKLNRATLPSAPDQEAQRRQQVEKTAGDLVSAALILPILKQLRRGSLNKNPVFGGGDGEKTFGPEFDMQIADRIAQSPNLPVRKALAERMLNRGKVIDRRPSQAAKVPGTGLHVNG